MRNESNLTSNPSGEIGLSHGEVERAAISKSAFRIVPVIVAMYFVSYLDRVNVSFAALTMNKELGFSATVYGWGAGLFFIGYFLGEVPSNLALERFGARKWLARIMVSWGFISGLMSFVGSPTSFYIIRFMLGLAEAGLFPGVILYLTYWFPTRARSRIIALFLAAGPLSTMIGAPLSAQLMGLAGVRGLSGWQWMFIVEAVPTVLVGIYVYLALPERPEKVKWLTEPERAALVSSLAKENELRSREDVHGVCQAFKNPKVLGFSLWYLLVLLGIYGVGFWMPQVIREFHFSVKEVGWIVAIPALVTTALMVPWSIHSDRTGERVWHSIFPVLVASLGLLLGAYTKAPVLVVVGFAMASWGLFASIPPFWALPVSSLTGSAAATGIALIGAVGNLGGYFGPLVLGLTKDATGGFSAGLSFLSVCVALSIPLLWQLSKGHRASLLLSKQQA
jgi:ACS family tartrate transporter-like MFS transporter